MGPGKFVNQDTLVANTQGGSSLKGSTLILTGSRVAGQNEPNLSLTLLPTSVEASAYACLPSKLAF